MSIHQVCAICLKGSTLITPRNKLRGKYNPAERIRKYPNLQWVFLASGKRVKACAKCIRTLAKVRT